MSELSWLSDAQMAKLGPFFPKCHGNLRVDDKRVLSGIIFIIFNGLRWRDAPAEYGPHKTLYSRWKRWSEKGIESVRHPHTFELTRDLRFRGFFGLWGVSRWELQASFWQGCRAVLMGSGIGHGS